MLVPCRWTPCLPATPPAGATGSHSSSEHTAVAAMRLRGGATNDAGELRDWINERVQARYQRVREVVLRDAFPTSLAGKTLRRVIREDYLERG